MSLLLEKEPIDALDLVINPVEGLAQLRNLPKRIDNLSIVIQPGAGSIEIHSLCAERKWKVFEGCVLVEFPRAFEKIGANSKL